MITILDFLEVPQLVVDNLANENSSATYTLSWLNTVLRAVNSTTCFLVGTSYMIIIVYRDIFPLFLTSLLSHSVRRVGENPGIVNMLL